MPTVFRAPLALLTAGSLLLGSCLSGTDKTADVHQPGPPATMMVTLHTMTEHSQALSPGDNLDVYFARLMRENHQAAVSMSVLELQQGKDSTLRALAGDIHRAHKLLIPGLDSAIQRIQTQPPSYPEHTQQSHEFAELLEAATKGLHPAAHRSLAGDTTPTTSVTRRAEKNENVSTGNIDRDYAALLIPHHQNAITLARAELVLGRDDQLKKVAFLILLDQQREMEQVQAWLRRHPAPDR